MRLALLVLLALLVIVAVQIAYYAPRLPATVAAHFTAGGAPDGWSSKTELLVLYVAIVLLVVLSFATLPLVLPRIPESVINLPHKDYWLAAVRREETFRDLGARMLWFGDATLMLVSHLMGVTLATNLTPHPRLGQAAALWPLVLYLAFTAVWLVSLLRHFYRKPPADRTGEDRFGAR